MKKIYLITLICLIGLISLSLVACEGGTSVGTTAAVTEANEEVATATVEETTSSETVETTAEVTTAEETTVEETTAMLYIAGTPISKYSIIYKKSPFASKLRQEDYKDMLPVYDFDHETANRLAALIEKHYGVKLNVLSESANTNKDHEILIGETNRSSTKELNLTALASDDYLIEVNEGQLVICGGEYGTTWHAIDALEALINESVDENGKAASISLNEDYSKKGEYHLTRIGCIGDSITEGTSAWNNDFTYPAQLGRFLWKDALVYNFGKSGATLRKDFEWNYFISSNYQSALEKANEIDLFFIMIGTN